MIPERRGKSPVNAPTHRLEYSERTQIEPKSLQVEDSELGVQKARVAGVNRAEDWNRKGYSE